MSEARDIKKEVSAWFEQASALQLDAFFCITVERKESGPPLVTVTIIPDGGFTKEQIDRARTHLEAIADVLRERAEKDGQCDE